MGTKQIQQEISGLLFVLLLAVVVVMGAYVFRDLRPWGGRFS